MITNLLALAEAFIFYCIYLTRSPLDPGSPVAPGSPFSPGTPGGPLTPGDPTSNESAVAPCNKRPHMKHFLSYFFKIV